MGKSKSSSSKPPEPPKPQNEYFYDDGFLRSSRVYNSGQKGYITNSYSTPEEQAIQNQATGFISDLVGRVPQAFNMTPEGLQAGVDAYTQPQMRALNESYNQASGAAKNAAASSGMTNSVGFNKYFADQIERNRAQGLADIAAGGEQMRYQLPRMALAPFTDAFNLYNAALSGEQAREMSQLEPAFQGSQAANNFALGNYQNQLAYHQARNQPTGGGGFFSKLFGGF